MLSKEIGSGGTVKTIDPSEIEGYRRLMAEKRTRSLIWKAKALEKAGDKAAALEVFEGLVGEFMDCGKGWLLYGRLLQRMDMADDAREVLKRGLKANPGNAILWQSWADLEKGKDRFDIARKLFRKGLEANSCLASLYHSWGGMEYRCGFVKRARRLYREGLKKCPGSCWLYHALAILEDKQGNSEVARSLLTRSLSQCPEDTHLLHALGVLEYRRGDFGTAREWFSRVLRVDPKHGMTILSWARLEEAVGNSDVARRYYRIGTGLPRGGTVQLWQSWARMEQKLGNNREALKLYGEAIRIHPRDTQLYCSWGKLLAATNEPFEAQKAFEMGLSVNEHCAPLWQGLALMHEGQLNVEEARRCYMRGATIGKGKGLAALLHSWAVMEWKHGDNDTARKLFQRAVEGAPKSAWLWLWYGSFEFASKNVELARHYFCRSINIDGKDASPWRAWADLEDHQGNGERAKSMLKKAAELEGVRAVYDTRRTENPLYRHYERFAQPRN